MVIDLLFQRMSRCSATGRGTVIVRPETPRVRPME